MLNEDIENGLSVDKPSFVSVPSLVRRVSHCAMFRKYAKPMKPEPPKPQWRCQASRARLFGVVIKLPLTWLRASIYGTASQSADTSPNNRHSGT